MPVPQHIWLELVKEWRGLMGLWEMPESDDYEEPGAEWKRARHVKNMITVASAWTRNTPFVDEADMGAKVVRDCEALQIGAPTRQQMRAAYAELRRRWPHEYEAGYDDSRLIGV